MNAMQVFQNSEFGELGVLEIDGKPYFPATACAKALGYQRPQDTVRQHCRYSIKHRVPHPQNPSREIEMNFIPEGDLYRLITHSKLPAAERFEKWVFDEVLPSIRKTGSYGHPNRYGGGAFCTLHRCIVKIVHFGLRCFFAFKGLSPATPPASSRQGGATAEKPNKTKGFRLFMFFRRRGHTSGLLAPPSPLFERKVRFLKRFWRGLKRHTKKREKIPKNGILSQNAYKSKIL